jgi:nifR3 family TIM-barrel protein
MNYLDLLERQNVFNAPMCGISDYPFRVLCRAMGAGLTFSEMIPAEGLVHCDRGRIKRVDLEPGEPVVAMQVCGNNPQSLAESGRILQDYGAAMIDLNMGCPARKITGNDCGSALMKDPQLVQRIVRAMRGAVRVPFTVKMRAGWDDKEISAIELARMCEAEGVDAVALHARTRQQGYSGQADWSIIARMKEALRVPVIGNGDVCSPADAVRMVRETGCDAIMIGRG